MGETPEDKSRANRLFENQKAFWTYDDLSVHTGIPVKTLQKYVHLKKIVPLRFGRSVRFDPQEAVRRLHEIGRSHVS